MTTRFSWRTQLLVLAYGSVGVWLFWRASFQ